MIRCQQVSPTGEGRWESEGQGLPLSLPKSWASDLWPSLGCSLVLSPALLPALSSPAHRTAASSPLLPAHLPAPKCSTCLSQSHQHWVLDEELFDGHEQ